MKQNYVTVTLCIKLNGFHQNVPRLLENKHLTAVFM